MSRPSRAAEQAGRPASPQDSPAPSARRRATLSQSVSLPPAQLDSSLPPITLQAKPDAVRKAIARRWL